MNDEGDSDFEGWEVVKEKWAFYFIAGIYFLCLFGLITITFNAPNSDLINDSIWSDFLYSIGIIGLVFINIFYPLAIYLAAIEIRLINDLYGKEIVCTDLDHFIKQLEIIINKTNHQIGKVIDSDTIYPSIIPSFFIKFTKVIEMSSIDIRIVLTRSQNGIIWCFLGPISSKNSQLLLMITKGINNIR